MTAHRVICTPEAAARYGEEYLQEWLKLPRCPDCDRPMRPHTTSSQDWPVTVVKAGGGYCSTHYAARRSRGSLPGDRRIDYPPLDRSERQQVASEWSAEQRSVALLVCEYVPEPSGAFEVMSMLGLFDDDPIDYSLDLRDPKGVAADRYS